MKQKKFVGIGARVTKALRDKFKAKAKKENRTASDQLRLLVEAYMKE